MKKLLSQLLGESAIYGISSMVSRFISIFLVPIYTTLLLPDDYGKLSLINSTFYFVTALAVFAMDSASARWYYDTEDLNEKKSIFSSWFWFQFFTSLILCIVIILSSTLFSRIILKEPNQQLLFIIPAVGLISSILPTMISNWLRYQRKAIHTVIFTICNVLLNIGLNILFVVYLKMNVKGILYALLISNSIASIYVLIILKDWIRFSYFSKQKLGEMLRYAMPLVPTAFAFWILNSSSTFLINYFHNKTEVGLFQIGSMVASAVGMVVGAFQMSWGPFAFSIIEKPQSKNVFSFVLTAYSALMCTVALGIALFAKEILILFTNAKYYDAYIVAGILAFNTIIYGYAYIAVIGSNIKKDNKPLAISIFLAAIITTIIYFFLVPKFGKEGAALSTFLGYIIVPIYLFYRSQKHWYIPFNFGLSIFIFSLAIGTFIFSIHLNENIISSNIIFKKLGLYIFYVSLVLSIIILKYPTVKKYLPKYLSR